MLSFLPRTLACLIPLVVGLSSSAAPASETTPTLRLARGEDGKVMLAFSPVPNVGEYAVRVVADNGKSEVIAADVANYTVHGLTNGRKYRFAVSAVIAGRRGPWSNELSATPVDQPDWETLREAFQSSNPTRNSNPFTMVHGKETEAELRAILRAAYDAGFEGVTLHPYGYEDYLGPGQWSRWKIILDQARRLGLVVWQQDDYNYPSGFAAGRVVAAHPEFGRTHLVEAARHNLTGPQPRYSLDIQSLLQGRDFLVAVSAYSAKGEPLDLTDRVVKGKLTWEMPPGRWRLFVVKAVWSGPMPIADSPTPMPFVDLMNSRAVDAYIQTIYQATFDHFGPQFCRTFKGFFSDEAPVDFAQFTPDFLDRFQQSKGYSLRKWLPSVTHDLSPRDKQVRFDYRDFIRQQTASVYFGRARQWCRDHGIRLIGHVIEDHQQDMRRLEFLSIPGFDNVVGQWYDPNPDVYWRMPKMASSVAHYAGSHNDVALVEHFAATGWRTGLTEMKRMMDWTTAMGLNQVVPCGLDTRYPSSWEVTPDFWAHGHNPQWPWFPAYQATANRMTMLMRGGRHVAPAIVLDTTESHWITRGTDLGTQHGAADDLWKTCATMSQAHVDFDLIPYYVFADKLRTTFARGRVQIGKEDYRAVILPPVEFIPAEVVERLQAFRDAGGIVVAIGRTPSASCNGLEDARVRAAVAAIWKPSDGKHGDSALTGYDNIEACLTQVDVPDVRIPSHPKSVLYCHRQLHGKDLYFFANTAAEPVSADVELRGAHGEAMLWYPVTGSISRQHADKDGNRGLRIRLGLGEYDSTFVVVEPVEPEPVALPGFLAHVRTSMTKQPFNPTWQVSKGADEYHRVFTAEAKIPADWDADSPASLEFQGASQIICVKVNDKVVGEQFCPPYFFDVGRALRPGTNRIVVERIGRFAPPNPNLPEFGANDAAATAPCVRATIWTFPLTVEKPKASEKAKP
ncbi:MAG: glycosyl hydrolase [Thermoguttaceae bacterium]